MGTVLKILETARAEDLVELPHNIPIVVVVVYMSTENMFVTPSTSWWLEWLPEG